MTADILTRLSDEADQCRQDGADDIARLLDDARAEVERLRVDAGRDKWRALHDRLLADLNRPEGRWGMHGHSAVDDDYFAALQYVIDQMADLLRPDIAIRADRAAGDQSAG